MDLLHVINGDKSHYVYIKDFDRFMFHKTKHENKKHFCKSCLQCFSSKNALAKYKKDCLSINGWQSVKLEKGTIDFKNYFKQISVPFKIFVDIESNLESVEIYDGSYTKKYQGHIPYSFAYKCVCIDDKFTGPIVFRGENAAYELINAILKEYEYCKKIIKKHFNKNLIKSEEEEQFQFSNIYWICERLIDHDDEKVRNHCHATWNLKVKSIGIVT